MATSAKNHLSHRRRRSSTAGILIQQWQWEAALDSLRRHVPESLLRTHWEPTGILEIDATARAHIAEWALFSQIVPWPDPEDVIESLIFGALKEARWDLYVVEDCKEDRLAVRGLRETRGFTISWLEGRELPTPGETLALRPAFLEIQGLHLSTLPLRFGAFDDPSAVMLAILQAFGGAGEGHPRNWRAFMADQGSRILLEYALSSLRNLANHRVSSLESTTRALHQLHQAFRYLELSLPPASPPLSCELPDTSIALLQTDPPGPRLLLFGRPEDKNCYLQAAANPTRLHSSSTGDVAWLRIHRVLPEELHPVEWELSQQANIDAAREGMIRIHARNASGLYLDPTLDDYLRLQSACRQLAQKYRHKAA